ncbi:unnamed protein product [Prorocentrum cordatum]|uniref:Uncharacterized protein n=1 Tax=Prorocentrum cordatum TaxID=2364126 RepID=A0ABN9TPY1_9DINO|nr:unnamed protein product [Polarella glacialis]
MAYPATGVSPAKYRCTWCNSLKRRTQQIRKGRPEAFAQWTHIPPEDKKAFCKVAAHLYGEDLVKKMTEYIEVVHEKSNESAWKEKGDAILLSEAKELPRFVREPWAFDNLVRNVGTFKCEHTGQEFIVVPGYSFENTSKEVHRETNSRTVEQVSKIPRVKAKAKAKAKTTAATQPTRVPKLPMGLAKKVGQALESLRESKLDIGKCLVLAESEQGGEFVPARLVAKLKSMQGEITTFTVQLDVPAKGADKEGAAKAIQAAKTAVCDHVTLIDQINGLLEDMPAEVRSALLPDEPAGANGETVEAAPDGAALGEAAVEAGGDAAAATKCQDRAPTAEVAAARGSKRSATEASGGKGRGRVAAAGVVKGSGRGRGRGAGKAKAKAKAKA